MISWEISKLGNRSYLGTRFSQIFLTRYFSPCLEHCLIFHRNCSKIGPSMGIFSTYEIDVWLFFCGWLWLRHCFSAVFKYVSPKSLAIQTKGHRLDRRAVPSLRLGLKYRKARLNAAGFNLCNYSNGRPPYSLPYR